MGEVKRYETLTGHGIRWCDHGAWVLHSDYARLERDHAATQAELTRLRAVEAAAKAVVSEAIADVHVHPCDHMNNEVRAQQLYGALRTLAEACGRKG